MHTARYIGAFDGNAVYNTCGLWWQRLGHGLLPTCNALFWRRYSDFFYARIRNYFYTEIPSRQRQIKSLWFKVKPALTATVRMLMALKSIKMEQ
jgi:hypothetical protein